MRITLTITKKTTAHVFVDMRINHELVGKQKIRVADFEPWCEIMEPDRIYDNKLLNKKCPV